VNILIEQQQVTPKGLVLPDCLLIHGGSPAVSPIEQEVDKPSGMFRGDLPEVQDAISVSQEPVVPNRKKGRAVPGLRFLALLAVVSEAPTEMLGRKENGLESRHKTAGIYGGVGVKTLFVAL
jgi:hypothetical protein